MEDNLNILINQGKEHLKTGKDDLALSVFYESLDIARDVRDQNNEAEILHRIAMIYNKKRDYENEIKFLTDSIKVFKQLQRNIDVLRGLVCVQYYYINQDNKSKAYRGLKRCERLSKAIKDGIIRSEIVRDISYGYYNLGKYKKAIKTFTNAIEIDESVETDCLIGMGKSYHELGKYEDAEKYLQQALELAESKEQYELELEALENLAVLTYETFQFSKHLTYLKRISIKPISITQKSKMFNDIGLELARQKNYEEGNYYLQKSLGIERELNDKEAEANVLRNISIILFERGELRAALILLKQSLEIAQSLNLKELEGGIFLNMGLIYHSMLVLSKAKIFLGASLKIATELRHNILKREALNGLGIVYLALREFEIAEYCFLQCFSLHEANNNKLFLKRLYDNLSSLSIVKNDLKKAKEYINKSYSLARELKIPGETSASIYGLGVIYGIKGNYSKAVKYIRKAIDTA